MIPLPLLNVLHYISLATAVVILVLLAGHYLVPSSNQGGKGMQSKADDKSPTSQE